VVSLQGLALWLMLFDHLAELFVPGVGSSWWVLLRVPGRVCMPAFAVLVASGVLSSSAGPGPYLRRLWLLAVVSEVPYWGAFGVPVNAVFALASGASVFVALRAGVWSRALLVSLVFGLLCFVLGQGFEVAYAGLVVFLAFWFSSRSGVYLVGAFGCSLFLNGGGFFAVLGALGLAWVLWGPLPVFSGLSRRFRYAFYPVHLAVLGLVRLLA
jgi:hypothetical protein